MGKDKPFGRLSWTVMGGYAASRAMSRPVPFATRASTRTKKRASTTTASAYDPEAGSYISQDLIGLTGGKRLYSYTTNPSTHIDPLGLSGIDLFRGMLDDGGKPKIDPSARGLGARPRTDIPVDPQGMVHPNTGGIFVSPRPQDLPAHRRPPEFGGTGKDPVWKMNTDDLGSDLKHVPDKPGYGTIQPSRSMHIDEYQKALSDTQQKWKRACPK